MGCLGCGLEGLHTIDVSRDVETGIPGKTKVVVAARACAHCGRLERPAATERAIHEASVRLAADSGRVNGATFRFLRKAAGLRAREVARTLGVSVGTISRWENEAREVDARSWVLVALLAVESLGGDRVVERVFSGIVRAKSEPPPTFVSVRHDEGTPFDEAQK